MRTLFVAVGFVMSFAAGCTSPYLADRGALIGGLGGAGAGALIGNAAGNTPAGAIIGAGVGTLAGAAIGSGLDEVEARNRAQIEQRLARQLPPGGVSTGDVIAMSKSGIDQDLIVNHIRANGVGKKIDANDLIMLQQEGVSKAVITTMQTTPQPQLQGGAPMMAGGPQPVIVEEHYYAPPPYYRGPRYYGPPPPYYYAPPPQVGVGFSYNTRR
ncbi:MAG: hypothetical protein K8U03_04495 [Planctomycetia bacterium]|nr:hypothetical protein [Planctomycetia bacterium]